MIRKTLVTLVALLGACTAGPDQAGYYVAPAVTLNARFAGFPAAEVSVDVDLVDYCTSMDWQQPKVALVRLETSAPSPLVGDSAHIDLVATSQRGPLDHYLCRGRYGELQFFRVRAGSWAPVGYDLVHAATETVFSPFGPNGPTVTLPGGYSWLRRICGATAGTMEMLVVSTDQVVDFSDLGSARVLPVELSEQALVESCGAIVPAPDLGTRISLDRAEALVWSADGAAIYYLALPDPADPSESVSLRQLRLADGAPSEVVVIPFGQGLQSDRAGQLYVGNADNLLRVDLAAGGGAALVPIPVPPYAVLSPDGRWLAYGELHVFDLQSGTEVVPLRGNFLGWSPDARLVYWSYDDRSAFKVWSPAAPGEPSTYANLSGEYIPSVVWSTEGPLLAHRPLAWSIQSGRYLPACDACFGLSLQDPVTGAERPVLDASVGMIDLVPGPPLLGVVLVWARTCLGLYNTVCSYSLVRVDLESATARQVAVSASEAPVAVSPDNQRIAIDTPNGIYVKSLIQ